MSLCQLTVLGSSSGMPSPSRFCSSVFVQTEDFNFLLDCGEGTSFSLLRNKIDPHLIDAVFISHAHIDHLGGLFLLIQMMHLLRSRIPLRVFLPDETIEGVRNFLNTCYLFPAKISFNLQLIPVADDFVFENRWTSLKAYPNRHLAGNQPMIAELNLPHWMQSYSYGLDIGDKKIVYSGDLESSDDLVGIIDDADLLITECLHPQLEKLIPLIIRSRVKSTVFTHIPAEMEDKLVETKNLAGKIGLENLVMAYDGLTIKL